MPQLVLSYRGAQYLHRSTRWELLPITTNAISIQLYVCSLFWQKEFETGVQPDLESWEVISGCNWTSDLNFFDLRTFLFWNSFGFGKNTKQFGFLNHSFELVTRTELRLLSFIITSCFLRAIRKFTRIASISFVAVANLWRKWSEATCTVTCNGALLELTVHPSVFVVM